MNKQKIVSQVLMTFTTITTAFANPIIPYEGPTKAELLFGVSIAIVIVICAWLIIRAIKKKK